MKKHIIMAVLLLCVSGSGCGSDQRGASVTGQSTEVGTFQEGETSNREEIQSAEGTGPESSQAGTVYYEIQLEAEPLDKEKIAAAIFGDAAYEIEEVDGTLQYFVGDEQAIDFITDTCFRYFRVPQSSAYSALLSSSYGALMYQDIRLESLFPKEALPEGGKEEAEQVCDGILEAIGYEYTEKRIFTLDAEYGNQIGLPYSPSQKEREEEAVWAEDDGAYLLIYQNGALVDVEEEIAYVSPDSVCSMVYSPKYGLCRISMEPKYHEVNRTEVEVISEEEAKALTRQLFLLNGIAYDLVEVTGYELVYCQNVYSTDKKLKTSSVVPCWKISFQEKESAEDLWEQEGLIARGTARTEGYLLLDARVGGDIYSFYPTPR